MKYKVRLIKINSEGREQTVNIFILDKKIDADNIIIEYKAIPRTYKILKGSKDFFYELSAN
jgi:hypothetical protein